MASFADQLKGKVVKHHSDNQNVVCVLFNGSKKQALHKIVLSIFNLCIDNKINLLPELVPRDDVIADLASKSIDRDDFMLHPDIFAALDILWDPILLTDSVLFAQGSYQGLIVVGQILVPKVLMLFLSDGIMRIIGYSHHQNSSQEC